MGKTTLTNLSSVSLPIEIIDNSFITLNVFNNGSLVFSGENTLDNVSIPLTEGSNAILVEVSDTAGNTASPVNFEIVRDSTPPIISNILPLAGADIGVYLFETSGSSNEPLSQIVINISYGFCVYN